MSQPQFLYLTTHGWKSGKEHRIEIWFVEYNERYYIISERLEAAHWVQNIKYNPKVSFSINDIVFNGTARIVDQEKESWLAGEVSKLMNTKYNWSQGLIVEVTPMNST
ncbi:MAG: nitroreductase family deazaflavin-dependent oxidoreductase [Thermoproteota archaeon]|nr:nitroreductase family deazaflavin-dependent oxidoreductase [Thermoproteota archaeon]